MAIRDSAVPTGPRACSADAGSKMLRVRSKTNCPKYPHFAMRGVSDARFTLQRCRDLVARALSRRWIKDGPGQIESELSK